MGDRTNISWTDATWNPIYVINRDNNKRGWFCIHASDGCRFCYAESMNLWRSNGLDYTAPNVKRAEIVLAREGKGQSGLGWPLRAKGPRRIFVCSMTDLFGEFIPDEFLDEVLAVCWLAPWHQFQLLTKRVDRARRYLLDAELPGRLADASNRIEDRRQRIDRPKYLLGAVEVPLCNLLVGASVEDQRNADERREDLAAIGARGWRTWVSYEPALGRFDWSGWSFIYLLVSGGESGANARPSHISWHVGALDWCVAHGVPFFFKQWGEWAPQEIAIATASRVLLSVPVHDWSDQSKSFRIGRRAAGDRLLGRHWRQFPPGTLCQPEAAAARCREKALVLRGL